MRTDTENLNGFAQIGEPTSSRSSRSSPTTLMTPVTAIVAARATSGPCQRSRVGPGDAPAAERGAATAFCEVFMIDSRRASGRGGRSPVTLGRAQRAGNTASHPLDGGLTPGLADEAGRPGGRRERRLVLVAARPGTRRLAAAAAGVASAVLGAGLGELTAALIAPQASPFAAIGSALIDLAPSWAKDAAIALFGTNDKLALLVGIAIVLILVAAGAGLLELWRPPWGRRGDARLRRRRGSSRR